MRPTKVRLLTQLVAVAGLATTSLACSVSAPRLSTDAQPSSSPPTEAGASPSAAGTEVDIPMAPDYQFGLAPGAESPLDAEGALAAALAVTPEGVIGKAPIVRLLDVRTRTVDYGPTWVILSTDAEPIGNYGDSGPAASIVATYSWVFLDLTGQFIGASRHGYGSTPPSVRPN